MDAGHILDDWNARDYLEYHYRYASVPADEAAMFRFIARGLVELGRVLDTGLELGCGPVLHHAAQMVPWVKRLDMADVQEANLDEIRRWLRREPEAFDWSVFIAGEHGVLAAEHGRGGTLAEREALLRERVQLMRCDLRDALPLGRPASYPLVGTFYCAEWVTTTLAGWHETMRKVAALVARGGWLFVVGVHASEYCVINGKRVPCARITDDELRRTLVELGFDSIDLDVTPGLRPDVSGIQGTFMARARRVLS
jgi:hypothetical protein